MWWMSTMEFWAVLTLVLAVGVLVGVGVSLVLDHVADVRGWW